MAKLLRKIIPEYPSLAKAARVSGVVRLLGVIAKDGTIRNLQLVSGHPLLARAALEAVKQWVYQPTLLNGQPVEVIAPIDVNFTLGQ
jgi:protein TonB